MDTTKSISVWEYGDEEFIDMELWSSQSSREFEFQNSITCNDKETTTSPADDLFYNGKLLPLLLPPRRLMLHLTTTAATTPSESCRVSCELSPDDERFFEWSDKLNTSINSQPTRKTLPKKLKLIKNSILGMNLKASRAYLRSLFTKSACSHDASAAPNHSAVPPTLAESHEHKNKNSRFPQKKPFRHVDMASHPTIASAMKSVDRDGVEDSLHRRSFSRAIKRHSPTMCLSSSSSSSSNSSSSSSSFSLSANGSHELHFLRSSSATDVEGSIEAAIAHCKKSQQAFDSRNSSREI